MNPYYLLSLTIIPFLWVEEVGTNYIQVRTLSSIPYQVDWSTNLTQWILVDRVEGKATQWPLTSTIRVEGSSMGFLRILPLEDRRSLATKGSELPPEASAAGKRAVHETPYPGGVE